MTGETSSASSPELPDNIGSFRAFTVLKPADLGAQGAGVRRGRLEARGVVVAQ